MKEVTNEQLAWAAGLVDGEGCFWIRKRKPKLPRHSPTYAIGFKVKMTHLPTIECLHQVLGVGYLYSERPGKCNVKTSWRLEAWNKDAVYVAQLLQPYLVTKFPETEIVIEFGECKKKWHAGKGRVPAALLAERDVYYERLRMCKQYDWSER